VARFPEKDEYVISTSEFQRVKNHLLKISNAKASIVADVDNQDNSRPTLKKRQPDATDSSGDQSGESSSSDNKPPQLKKKDAPAPAPTPTPQQ